MGDAITPRKYRKRPVVIEAYQTDRPMIIATLEGDMRASPGDWIITGVNGEQYPCKPDIFTKTYETVIEANEIEVTEADREAARFICAEYICESDKKCGVTKQKWQCVGCVFSDEEIAEVIACTAHPLRSRMTRMENVLRKLVAIDHCDCAGCGIHDEAREALE